MKNRFKPKYSIKKGDQVVVISGANKDRNTPKSVLAVFPDPIKPTVIIEGVNIKTKHLKPNAQNTQGSIIKKEAPIALSNVMLWDTKEKKGTRITRVRNEGKASRISKKSGQII